MVRERAIRLIHTKMKTSATEFASKETQAELIAQIKKVFASGCRSWPVRMSRY